MLFRQMVDLQSSTYTYLLADESSRQAVLIDPVFEQARRDSALLAELDLQLVWTVETHVHADHVSAGWLLRDRWGSRIAISRASGASGADRLLDHGDRLDFGSRSLEVRATPGHTSGCITCVLDTQAMAFTGDALLIRGCGRTDFQQGSAERLYQSVNEQIYSLPDACLLYPAHDYRGLTVTSVGEEKRYNPRLGVHILRDDFVGYMKHLGLPHPKQMDVAVPANLECGRPGAHAPAVAEWAPVTYTFAGILEIQPQWLEEHLDDVQLVDVREPAEFEGPLGRIPGAMLVPMGALGDALQKLSRDKPIVTVCRSGARSAQATVLLQKAGFTKVANLAGGMLRWRAQRHSVEGAID